MGWNKWWITQEAYNDDNTNNTNNKNNNNDIKFKKLMIRSSLCDYSNAYILAKGTITVPNTAA